MQMRLPDRCTVSCSPAGTSRRCRRFCCTPYTVNLLLLKTNTKTITINVLSKGVLLGISVHSRAERINLIDKCERNSSFVRRSYVVSREINGLSIVNSPRDNG